MGVQWILQYKAPKKAMSQQEGFETFVFIKNSGMQWILQYKALFPLFSSTRWPWVTRSIAVSKSGPQAVFGLLAMFVATAFCVSIVPNGPNEFQTLIFI